jgi:hypothetical protein
MSIANPTNDMLFVLGDGDRIRSHLEKWLLAGDLEELATFSAALTTGISNLTSAAHEQLGARIIMAGGDDVLFQVKLEAFSISTLEKLSETFLQATGCTISFGVASDVEQAYLCLRKAKARGGGAIVVAEARP